ncbi:hypothetical protein EJB05_30198, partial [Eragrostis curvula]
MKKKMVISRGVEDLKIKIGLEMMAKLSSITKKGEIVSFMTIGVWKPQKVTWKGVQQQPTQNPKTKMIGWLTNSRTDLMKVAVEKMDQG